MSTRLEICYISHSLFAHEIGEKLARKPPKKVSDTGEKTRREQVSDFNGFAVLSGSKHGIVQDEKGREHNGFVSRGQRWSACWNEHGNSVLLLRREREHSQVIAENGAAGGNDDERRPVCGAAAKMCKSAWQRANKLPRCCWWRGPKRVRVCLSVCIGNIDLLSRTLAHRLVAE